MASSNPLFSSYRTGENRVTASMVAVFERIGIAVLQRVLAGALENDDQLELVTFRNQVANRGGSVPDASISASFHYLIEVKTEVDARMGRLGDQIERHLKSLNGGEKDQRLLLITPDPESPAALSGLSGEPVDWVSFSSLAQAIRAVIKDEDEPIPSETAFLLRELVRLFEEEGLTEPADTVIVAAGRAYPAYLTASAYVCPPGRSFKKGLTHMGFYANGEIKPHVARIMHRSSEPVLFTEENAERLRHSGKHHAAEIADAIEAFLNIVRDHDREGREWDIFLLSGPEDDKTVRLSRSIQNVTRTESGRPWAWTLSKRYTRLEVLQAEPKTTAELDAGASASRIS